MSEWLAPAPEAPAVDARPSLPRPLRERWQPLRIGLVELFHYDSEEFWFHDGHLLLRGNNGTGKSKVLSLTLPLLLDAQLRPSRVEPDGDAGKKMAWNLLMGSYARRIGYSWIEFGRRDRDGGEHYLTLGAGLSAVEGRAEVDSWFFVLEADDGTPGPRIGQDLWLTTADRQVLTRERLREALAGRGQLFHGAHAAYRRAVDERLFRLGARRYDALMDTLVQLRQPQLSKKPDEAGLSNALSEALPPLPAELLGDVAEALNQLEEDRRQLEETRQLQQAVAQFEQRYRVYTGMLARRQARELRQAQTGFDNASEARHEAQATLERAHAAEGAATAAHEAAHRAWAAARERLETLQSDPANQDANRLGQAQGDARQRREAGDTARRQRDDAQANLQREAERGRQRRRQADEARAGLEAARADVRLAAARVGLEDEIAAHPWLALATESLVDPAATPPAAAEAMRGTVLRRRRDLDHLRRLQVEVEKHQAVEVLEQENLRSVRAELDAAIEQRRQADLQAEREGAALVEAWAAYAASLVQLQFDAAEPLRLLAEWAARPEGDDPARLALSAAWQAAMPRYAARQAELEARRAELQRRQAELEAERARLSAGEHAVPPEPPTRAPAVRAQRAGAPLWRLLDFRAHLPAHERAGLEAALEASGLLDAWVTPDGALSDAAGEPLLDTQWLRRAPVAGTSLGDALTPDLPAGCAVAEGALVALLRGVAWGNEDRPDAEAWLSPAGRFRIGTLAGAWHKPEARYIGRTARELARRRRLEEIAAALAELEAASTRLDSELRSVQAERERADQEHRDAPPDRLLRTAVAAADSAGREVARTRQRMAQAQERVRAAGETLHAARDRVLRDATDLRLPAEAAHLPAFEQALEEFDRAQTQLAQRAHAWQRDWPAHVEQQQREAQAQATVDLAHASLSQAEREADEASARFEALRRSVGMKVDALLEALRAARDDSRRTEAETGQADEARRAAGERRAVAQTEATQREQALEQRTAERIAAAERLHRFASSGLLACALPGLPLPESWTIDPALNLARRIEQELRQVADDDKAWERVPKQVAEDLIELQRALGSLGHQASSEPSDWGLLIHIQYQNRAERPGTLAASLADDVAQRSELLSAREREVLENHLQAEIASAIQRLMRAADERVTAINEELRGRPTSTGVRYRLKWEPLSTEQGAPAGLDLARERLLNTSADLWSAEDRRVVGSMLQQQIAAERARGDADATSGSLAEQLARALDYRYWHRFAVQRQQDGQWRRLSGPASSGERALGLTVPLFAAIASFYGHGASPLAPRLMLLDEAFAGIDDLARAHCMGLIREFDLDFVITSEREWGCYAELPGVAICQLQRREGVDAVFVSRWTWDGRARRVDDDPDRRFPPPA